MGDRIKVKLVSTGLNKDGKRTGFFKTTTKRSKPKGGSGGSKVEKLEKKAFDPRAYDAQSGKTGIHVLFKEDKIK